MCLFTKDPWEKFFVHLSTRKGSTSDMLICFDSMIHDLINWLFLFFYSPVENLKPQ